MASLRSTPGRSTCAPHRTKARPSGSNSRPHGKRFMSKGAILVVDDESEIREGLELLLTTEGYSTSSAETGEAGLALLEEKPFDLVLLDVSLPDPNGPDLLPQILHA